ncbi:FAD-binding and (Fe-S)-binding domain-containing protein [Mucilaginibacter dorajii]|uniref:FAD-binding and (Fe-S)-binding domain-containing protein n=1 Tax=Mucilaginibacter dorajii TaxID=692994 RepID=A0ABP7QXT9_9SPHI|nr:FAD-binding and (Fe-S)-binding domain-containing protein [Mucilaginibacter dorajii]MCS3732369.1 FAD/FMN-containing dehydrogenase/Fe-S oxidoreductase [Mucilaginibacter dorajii]
MNPIKFDFQELTKYFSGELFYDESITHRAVISVYATDASVYQEQPVAVAMPRDMEDIKHLIIFANKHKLTLIPRAAGTSLAGQVVGHGLVIDISKHMTAVLEVNEEEKWVRVQPGVIRDDLNAFLKPYGLMFGPETSTSSRAMIGGMIGNNSCGLHSMIWGATRDNLLEVTALLADASEVVFSEISLEQLYSKRNEANLEGRIYNKILRLVEQPENQSAIINGFPRPEVARRNSGYALDSLVNMLVQQKPFNLSTLIAGSEGTLCFITEAKLKLLPLPPKVAGMVAVHCSSLHEALLANLIAVKSGCAASELVDHVILEQAIKNPGQLVNRFFLEGKPNAILMVEFFDDSHNRVVEKCKVLIQNLEEATLGYAYPVLTGEETKKAWELRKAGLGLLRNLKGDVQPVNLIEDCAVSVEDLPAYIHDLDLLLKKHNTPYSAYAHAGAGELHVEPMISLKTEDGRQLFKQILAETAILVKKYRGSLSGEHGDGRLRGEYISYVMGTRVYDLFKEVKYIFDPAGIFNQGKITNTPSMLANLRYEGESVKKVNETLFDFSQDDGMLRLTEKCSGSGDCRKTEITGGTMCPSYMATRNEKDTTRARANMLRQYLNEEPAILGNGKTADMVKDVLDLCLACKGCKIECPSSVDMTKLRAEFLYHYQQQHGIPFRSRLVGHFSNSMKLASKVSMLYNAAIHNKQFRKIINNLSGFHPARSLPAVSAQTLKAWYKSRSKLSSNNTKGPVYFFCDEFTNYNDVEVGKKAILLLEKLGYQVIIPVHVDSGRSFLSKGMLQQAKQCAEQNIDKLHGKISAQTPLIGIEPSAILSFRDEYPSLVSTDLKEKAFEVGKYAYLFEEWLYREVEAGHINKDAFSEMPKKVVLHGHCHQKALSDMNMASAVLSLPRNYKVEMIPSGCCGMAGSFGYEKEHYDVSMKIGGLVLFPAVNKQPETTLIAAAGTSCRHQIKDGTQRIALHPAEILYDALF